MAIEFCGVQHPPLRRIDVSAPDGAVIGLVGLKGSGTGALLALASGMDAPAEGAVRATGARRLIRAGEALDLSPVDILALDHALACEDPLRKAQALTAIEGLRRAGATILIASYDEALLRRACDEIWWLREGELAAKGDPSEMLAKFNDWVARQFAQWGASVPTPFTPQFRRGDSRAEIMELDALNAAGDRTVVWRSGEDAGIGVRVGFRKFVQNPVIGIMIRTRIGLEVYGTNTELEGARVGPCRAGDVRRIVFRFRCDLCPGDYTITAASHDPDGTAHDWLDDAVAVSVTDSRYTAGVANLRASVSVERA
ncbi:MAG TPA: Wzt carbohydrate-binding domain-containing protein [Bryobacteraceae bacterium]|nr:Wzt carbohydrate-binding domain-containing protein [Bryobacteraceae bacterium]